MHKDEPRLFIDQINCAELRGLPGADLLPSSGLLAFFGDHDAVEGCFPFDAACVFYWPEPDRLGPATAALEPIKVFPPSALALRSLLDLPPPSNRAVSELGLNAAEQKSYADAWGVIRDHGIPPASVHAASFSKLPGWPHLAQGDVQKFEHDKDTARLLLQVDGYYNCEDWHFWGRAARSIAFCPKSICAPRKFDRCELEGQFT